MRKPVVFLILLCLINIMYWSVSEYIRGGDYIYGLQQGLISTVLYICAGLTTGLVVVLLLKNK